jgi:hypothetical protein
VAVVVEKMITNQMVEDLETEVLVVEEEVLVVMVVQELQKPGKLIQVVVAVE